MKFSYINSPFHYILIDSFFAEDEYDDVWKELVYLTPKMKDPDERYSNNFKNEPNKKGKGLFLRDVFINREVSTIFQRTRKLHSDEVIQFINTTNYLISGMRKIARDESIVVQNYTDGDYYKPHLDFAILSAITVLHKTPKLFEGGNLYFPNFKHEIELQNNQTIIFPSFVKHEVKQIKMNSKNPEDGRYSITHFLQAFSHQNQDNQENN